MVGQRLPAGTAPGLLDIVLRGRPDRATLFQQAGLDADTVAGGDVHLTAAQLDALLGTAFTQAGDPLFGLRVGRANHYRDLGPLGFLMAACETLEQALRVLQHYRELLLPYLAVALHREEHQCTLTVSGGEALAVTPPAPITTCCSLPGGPGPFAAGWAHADSAGAFRHPGPRWGAA